MITAFYFYGLLLILRVSFFSLAARMWSRTEEPHPTQNEVAAIGRSTWTLLHSIAKYYPKSPTPRERKAVAQLLEALEVLFPCRTCAVAIDIAAKNGFIDASSRSALSASFCHFHNLVNRKLGKKEVNCPDPSQTPGIFASLREKLKKACALNLKVFQN